MNRLIRSAKSSSFPWLEEEEEEEEEDVDPPMIAPDQSLNRTPNRPLLYGFVYEEAALNP